jgi:hypothetical protein
MKMDNMELVEELEAIIDELLVFLAHADYYKDELLGEAMLTDKGWQRVYDLIQSRLLEALSSPLPYIREWGS